jgi:hypothetical protein
VAAGEALSAASYAGAALAVATAIKRRKSPSRNAQRATRSGCAATWAAVRERRRRGGTV